MTERILLFALITSLSVNPTRAWMDTKPQNNTCNCNCGATQPAPVQMQPSVIYGDLASCPVWKTEYEKVNKQLNCLRNVRPTEEQINCLNAIK